MDEKELNVAIEQAKEIVREVRKATLRKLHRLVLHLATGAGVEDSREALDKNCWLSTWVQNSDCQHLYWLGEHIADVDWVEGQLYPCTKEMETLFQVLGI